MSVCVRLRDYVFACTQSVPGRQAWAPHSLWPGGQPESKCTQRALLHFRLGDYWSPGKGIENRVTPDILFGDYYALSM